MELLNKESRIKIFKHQVIVPNKYLVFTLFLIIMIIDRILTLIYFGFVYTDIDQMVMWDGAFDYSKGVFHEPYFYGQPFNFMLESFLAVPLIWMNIPVYIAMPVTTSLISILPFIILSLLLIKKEYFFWAFLCMAIPIILPIEYNFLTTISRGNVQAHFFASFLFIPLFNPESKKNVTVLFLASGFCFLANPSSFLLILPIVLFVFTYHYNSLLFYFKSLLILPFFIIDYFAKHFYKTHPEKVLHDLVGMKIDFATFISNLKNGSLFSNLFPFCPGLGIVYPFVFISLAFFCIVVSKKRQLVFIITIIILLLITLAVPKIQENIPGTGIFLTSSRFYLFLPLLLIVMLFLVFREMKINSLSQYILFIVCCVAITIKNINIKRKVEKTISETIFPVAKNSDLIQRHERLQKLVIKYHLDLMVHTTFSSLDYVFDSYAYNLLTGNCNDRNESTISINLDGDRRTWLYQNAENCKQILLNGFKVDESLLKGLNYEIISQNQIVIKGNKIKVQETFRKLNIRFGIASSP